MSKAEWKKTDRLFYRAALGRVDLWLTDYGHAPITWAMKLRSPFVVIAKGDAPTLEAAKLSAEDALADLLKETGEKLAELTDGRVGKAEQSKEARLALRNMYALGMKLSKNPRSAAPEAIAEALVRWATEAGVKPSILREEQE